MAGVFFMGLCRLGCGFFGDAELALDRGDALQRVIDFLGESDGARALLLQPLQAAVNCGQLG